MIPARLLESTELPPELDEGIPTTDKRGSTATPAAATAREKRPVWRDEAMDNKGQKKLGKHNAHTRTRTGLCHSGQPGRKACHQNQEEARCRYEKERRAVKRPYTGLWWRSRKKKKDTGQGKELP